MSDNSIHIKPFNELKTSTMTVMAYTNIDFNFDVLFNKLPITEVDLVLTKKKKTPDMKKIEAPYNSIISVRYKNKFRGINTKPNLDIQASGNYFLNQVTCILSMGGKKHLNIMIFRNKFKIAGTKTMDQAYLAVKLLWGHISAIKNSYENESDIPPRFVFSTAMRNADFKLGFIIDRMKLNNLMNRPEYRKDLVHVSRFNAEENTNVNIKMQCNSKFRKFTCMTFYDNNKPKFSSIDENIYDIKKNKKKNYTTFLVFRSSKVIISGKFYDEMKEKYERFTKIILKYKKDIEENIKQEEQEEIPLAVIERSLADVLLDLHKNKEKFKKCPQEMKTFLKSLPKKCTNCGKISWWKDTKLVNDKVDERNYECGICGDITFTTSLKETKFGLLSII